MFLADSIGNRCTISYGCWTLAAREIVRVVVVIVVIVVFFVLFFFLPSTLLKHPCSLLLLLDTTYRFR